MIEPGKTKLPVSRQLELIGLNNSVYYYKKRPRTESNNDVELKSNIQALYAEQTAGYRVMHGRLQLLGFAVGEKPVRRLMSELRLYGPYPKRNLSKQCQEHKKYPYLLRGLNSTLAAYTKMLIGSEFFKI